jgi:hypothetical protein
MGFGSGAFQAARIAIDGVTIIENINNGKIQAQATATSGGGNNPSQQLVASGGTFTNTYSYNLFVICQTLSGTFSGLQYNGQGLQANGSPSISAYLRPNDYIIGTTSSALAWVAYYYPV